MVPLSSTDCLIAERPAFRNINLLLLLSSTVGKHNRLFLELLGWLAMVKPSCEPVVNHNDWLSCVTICCFSGRSSRRSSFNRADTPLRFSLTGSPNEPQLRKEPIFEGTTPREYPLSLYEYS